MKNRKAQVAMRLAHKWNSQGIYFNWSECLRDAWSLVNENIEDALLIIGEYENKNPEVFKVGCGASKYSDNEVVVKRTNCFVWISDGCETLKLKIKTDRRGNEYANYTDILNGVQKTYTFNPAA